MTRNVIVVNSQSYGDGLLRPMPSWCCGSMRLKIIATHYGIAKWSSISLSHLCQGLKRITAVQKRGGIYLRLLFYMTGKVRAI